MRRREARAFTLIELLVVIAIIALLVSILLPALGAARATAQMIKCAAHMRSVGQGVAVYVSEQRDWYPPSYVYGAGREGTHWNFEDQLYASTSSNGYVHWSYALLSDGDRVPEDAFTCPSVTNGGAPATNPGGNPSDWEPGQRDEGGNTMNNPPEWPKDRQAKRIAFTGNAAIFPRNKFAIGDARRNQLVRGALVDGASRGTDKIILATEFYDNGDWSSIAINGLMKSHRPVTPVLGRSSGVNVYNEPVFGGRNVARFVYPTKSALLEEKQKGPNMIESPASSLNAVGRNHGHKTNFVFVDGHVSTMELEETVKQRLWGDRFYSITGPNEVDLDFNEWQ